ncbi:MAG TPA: protein phosphatase 2C domain-containing protein [Gemmatimonadales bacterium]|nr:protein phosphatase 2C domain-containing protein [Gemmatimonadales bacterium]
MTVSPAAERVPRQSDVDAFGLTHPGKIRPANADQFLIVTLHKTTQVQASSLPTAIAKNQTSDARAYIFLVADGVGSGAGVHASEAALRHVMSYVTHATKLCYTVDAEEHDHFLEELKLAVARAHDEVHQDAQVGGVSGMATTLTLVAFIWPMAYLVHVGDSRCYRLRDGTLQRITHDQTMAQALVDAGALTNSKAEQSPLKHILTSAVGSDELRPEVGSDLCQWDDVLLLCSDGLNKHVSDSEIAEVLKSGESSETMTRRLIDLALERGGSDNITVVIGKLR